VLKIAVAHSPRPFLSGSRAMACDLPFHVICLGRTSCDLCLVENDFREGLFFSLW
jgi:hypothetical protein